MDCLKKKFISTFNSLLNIKLYIDIGVCEGERRRRRRRFKVLDQEKRAFLSSDGQMSKFFYLGRLLTLLSFVLADGWKRMELIFFPPAENRNKTTTKVSTNDRPKPFSKAPSINLERNRFCS